MHPIQHGHDFAFGTNGDGIEFDFDAEMMRSWEAARDSTDGTGQVVDETLEQTWEHDKERVSDWNYIGWNAPTRPDLCTALRAQEAKRGKSFRRETSNTRMARYKCTLCPAFVQIRRKGCAWHVTEQEPHVTSCGTCSRTATSALVLSNENIVGFVSRFPSRLSVDIAATRNQIQAEGFACASTDAPAKQARKAATRYAKIVADKVFEVDEVPKMLGQLRSWVEQFPNVPRNGVAVLSTTKKDTVFEHVFVVYESSCTIAMHSAMRIVAVDAAHVQCRKDLRLLLMEGMNADNHIFPIAFMVCFGETIATLTKFFHHIKASAPTFWKWLDDAKTIIIADRGPGACMKTVINDCFATAVDTILRSCAIHVLRSVQRNFSVRRAHCVQEFLTCSTRVEVEQTFENLRVQDVAVHDFIKYKTDPDYWIPAYVDHDKADFFKITSNMVECEFSRLGALKVRDLDVLSMCQHITELVSETHTQYDIVLQNCKHQLTPYARKIHEEQRSQSVEYEVLNFAKHRPDKTYQVYRRHQLGFRKIGGTCSLWPPHCSQCDIFRRLEIPCAHMECLGNATGASIGRNYDEWLAAFVGKRWHVQSFAENCAKVHALNPSPLVEGLPLDFPYLKVEDKAKGRQHRYRSRNESATTALGYKKAAQAPPKRTYESQLALTAQEHIMKRNQRQYYFMIRYNSGRGAPSSAKYENGVVPTKDTFRPIRLRWTRKEAQSTVRLHTTCLLTKQERQFLLHNILDAVAVSQEDANAARKDHKWVDPRVRAGQRRRIPNRRFS
eukprot:SAG31_NODE_2501_length_5594_cov_43.918653_3_plen_782_part_00